MFDLNSQQFEAFLKFFFYCFKAVGGFLRHPGAGMGEIINIGNLNLRNYHISFCNRHIDIDNCIVVSSKGINE
jgi:hypothetical protein